MKNKLPKIFLFFAVLSTFYLILNTGFAQAQTAPRTITIVPPSKEHALNPGDKTEGILKVVNDGTTPITFTATVRDYVVNDNAGTPTILPPNTLSNKFSAANWIAVTPTNFTIQPHQRQEINYYVQVPADARPGGHYAAIVYEPTDIIGVQGTGTGVQTQIGTLFYIDVNGAIKESANVKQFTAAGFNEYGPVKISTEILNNGDLHIKPVGTITVKNIFGGVVATQALPAHNIFPEASFLFKNALGHKWMFGRYTATLNATYGKDSNLPLTATVAFIVFPWKVVTVVILIIIIIILAIVAFKRNKKKKEHEHHEQAEGEHPAAPAEHTAAQ